MLLSIILLNALNSEMKVQNKGNTYCIIYICITSTLLHDSNLNEIECRATLHVIQRVNVYQQNQTLLL